MEVENKEVGFEDVVEKVAVAATLFNRIASGGLSLGELSLEELHQKIVKQYGIAKEEVEETKKALDESDTVEFYDGAIDSFFTVEPLIEMLELYILGTGLYQNDIPNHFNLNIIELLECYKNLPLESLDVIKLNKVADMIIENNQQKFTTSKDDFDKWESPYNQTSLNIDGVTYYFLVDENGKVRKHNNFKEVNLTDVVLDGEEAKDTGGTNNNDKA